MSDSLVLLLDKTVSADDASAVGDRLLGAMIDEGIVQSKPNDRCVLVGLGYPPGPRLRDLYRFGERELPYWELRTCGVRVRVENYVNFWAFPVFERSNCPRCGSEFRDDFAPLMDALYDAVATFVNENELNDIVCPRCEARVPADEWTTVPDVGICRLAIEFWNWPPFDAPGWRQSIPDLLRERTGRSLKVSWGRM